MSPAMPIVSFHNVGLFAKEEFGVANLSFRLFGRERYRFVADSPDRMKCVLQLLESKVRPDTGFIRKEEKLFCQSDRLLMGDRVIDKRTEEYLGLRSPQFQFDGRKRSKHYFIDLLEAKHILFYPVYKLKGENRIKFTLLALLFQGAGLLLISDIIHRNLSARHSGLLIELIRKSHNTLCLFSCKGENVPNPDLLSLLESIQPIEIG